jgi:hypothetical protein
MIYSNLTQVAHMLYETDCNFTHNSHLQWGFCQFPSWLLQCMLGLFMQIYGMGQWEWLAMRVQKWWKNEVEWGREGTASNIRGQRLSSSIVSNR